jgi:uncharacterized YigZ family protein
MSYILGNELNKCVGTSEIIIKKSKFLGFVYVIDSEAAAQSIIKEIKEKYRDARHVVYAYTLKNTAKFSDDGEPQGTAGKPIYDILQKLEIINTLIIVVRYFGGVLLGAGPLLRAYKDTVCLAISKCEKEEYVEYVTKEIISEYKDERNVLTMLYNHNVKVKEIIRTDKVKIICLVPLNIHLEL